MLDFGFYEMDCMEGMKRFPDKYFGLAIVDTPYGIGESENNNSSRSCLAESKNYGKKNWDNEPPPWWYFKELFRVSKNQIIWGANHFIDRFGLSSPCWIVWDKENGENDFADCELAWTSFDTAVRKVRRRWHGMLQHDMSNKEIRIHPTQKPITLYRWLLHNYAKPGQIILDTHVGSASSLIACEQMGFKYVGFELDQEYYEAASKRIEKEREKLKQTNLVF